MTSREFHIGFDVQLDKTLDFEYPYIQSEEKDFWLNQAQERIIKQKLFGNNPKQTAYDSSLQRVDDLKTLIKNVNIVGNAYSGNLTAYIKEFDLPADYKFYIKAFVLVDKLMRTGFQSTQTPFPVDIIQRLDMAKYMTISGINRPDLDKLKGFLEEEKLVVIHDSYTTNVNTCKLTYVKKPLKFDYTIGLNGQVTDLPEHVHPEILDEAIALVLNNFESQRLGSQIELNKTNE